MFISIYDFCSILSEIYMLICINFLLVYGVLFSTSLKKGYPNISLNLAWLCIQVSLISILILFFSSDFDIFIWNQLLTYNFFIYGIKLILLVSFIVWVLLSLFYATYEKLNSFEYWVLSLLAVVSMIFIVKSCDLLSMYLSIECQSLILYILASFKRTSEFSTESGLKYFILGAFSSALLLFGSSILYGLTGLTGFDDYMKLFSGLLLGDTVLNSGIIFGSLVICISLLFKISSAPFHVWSPDVYEGAPTSSTLFFSILPKLSILVLFLRFCFLGFQDFFYSWQKIIFFCTYLSIFVGTFGAFAQNKWKRFLAYSSINHVGFILLGFSTGELESIFSVIFYVLVYIILTFGVFAFLISLRYFYFPVHYQIRYIKDLISLFEINSTLTFSLTLLLFSMAGIPPLLGFFSKVFVLLIALQSNLYSLSFFSVIMSCITCFYYIRLIKLMYFDKTQSLMVTYPLNKLNSMLLSLFTVLSSFLFLDLELLLIFSTHISLLF
uniref:NADH dehydrogenase subunit 2 n=1 Tax=Kumanoa mahlacensis TaxID=1196387 RepID=A0A343UXW2_9FLOR|nr:NADH dehydrogenase subunit 2 [Kumanoa mahlacensis]AVK39519.1 NADH dehydrogenase subunit 2 [Kumanoa mahlacensis]UEQ11850.1 NADH dehydrogenase subunit 2 [Kumanoa mahlacensis]